MNQISKVIAGDYKALARCISFVENEVEGYEAMLRALPVGKVGVTGITGPPGAGKSTLVDALLGEWVRDGKKVAVLCVDPSSPFNLGALLGDRIRMSDWYNHPNVFIRSLATRGALGGLHPHILDITLLLQAAPFDHLLVETVGVGQSEIDIAGLADTTVVVLVPEAGDEVQTMKAGLMEIADVFVVNKSDRPGADLFAKNVRMMLAPSHEGEWQTPVIQTVAAEKKGIRDLIDVIDLHQQTQSVSDRKHWLLTERAYQLIQQKKMKQVNKHALKAMIENASIKGPVNLYAIVELFD